MSGIFGLFHLDNSPVSETDLNKMAAAMAHWGPDGRSQIVSGSIGLGQLMLHNTPQAQLEKLPRQTTSGLLLTAEARLDNRTELCQLFGIPHPDREATTDSQLIELAYDKWGESCPDHLLGDWSFAIWNPQTQRLFVARDHHGNTSLYYYQDSIRFLFASSREALLAMGVPRRLNELYLAQVLISWSAYHGERTIDLDIYRLPPAHAMTVTPQETAVHRYWRLEDTPELNLPTFADYVAGFLEVYTEAVNCRLRSSKPIGVTLSGGLDSGSVAALAARTLASKGERLTAFTSVPLYDVQNTVGPTRFGDETDYAQETAAFYSNIDHQLLNASETTPLDGIRRILAIRNEPGHAGGNFYWIADMLQTAQQQGIGTLLTGQGGNATISWLGAPELASLKALWQAEGWKATAKKLMPLFLLRAWRYRAINRHNWAGTAIHPEFAQRINLTAQQVAVMGQDNSLPESWKTPRDKRYAMIKPGSNLLGTIWAEIGAGFHLEVRDPTFDKRVLMYTIAIPDHFFRGINKEDRWLLRTAMAELLPESVRLNPKRGRQAADLVQRLQNTSENVERILTDLIGTEAANYIELHKLQTVWHTIQADLSKENSIKAVTILMRGLNASLFLNKSIDPIHNLS